MPEGNAFVLMSLPTAGRLERASRFPCTKKRFPVPNSYSNTLKYSSKR
jgi:hypothetical protein